MKFIRMIFVIRENVCPLSWNGPVIYLHGKTSASSYISPHGLAGEAPAL